MPSLREYRSALARALDDQAVYTAIAGASGPPSTVTINELANSTSGASAHRYDGQWLFNQTGGAMAKVATGGLAPSTGTLTLVHGWPTAVAGDRIELSSLFPPVEQVLDADTSYRTIINRTLQMLLTLRRIQLPIVPLQQAYSLAAYAAWLDREERLGWPDLPSGAPQPRLLEPGPTGGAPTPADWRRPHLRLDGQSPYLEIEAPFVAGSTGVITLNVMSPAYFFIKVSGVTWAEGQGLVNDVDEALPSVADVVAVGLWQAATVLAARGLSTASGDWASKVDGLEADAMRVRYFDRTALTSAPAAPAAAPQQAAAA